MKRQIIKIDEKKCTGCGLCIPGCPEGALQVIDGKARLISDLFCDGLGACLGECPEKAISVEEREAEPYDERKVMGNIIKQGDRTIEAHLSHLKEHGEIAYLKTAVDFLQENNYPVLKKFLDNAPKEEAGIPCGCPGSMAREINRSHQSQSINNNANSVSELAQWPVQLQLINPQAPYFKNADMVIAADCVPFSYANFHQRFLKNKKLIIFCPKLDATIENYIQKLKILFETQNIQSISIVHMEVPCCFGVGKVVEEALRLSGKNIIIKDYTISISGEIL